MIKYFFSYRNLSKSLKNLLIFFPIIFSNINITQRVIQDLLLGFFIFFVITNFIYVINDYIDKIRDLKNCLKYSNSLGNNLSKKNFFLVNIFLLFFLLMVTILKYGHLSLWLYIINFYFYCCFLKKIKYMDVISLHLFYILRLFYGSELVDINISFWFISFFSTFFLILSLYKRYIQIYVNNLSKANSIIPYNTNDAVKIKYLIYLMIIINFSIIILYFMKSHLGLNFLSSTHTNFNFYLEKNLLILVFYYVNVLRLNYFVLKNKIYEDIFYFVTKDKFILLSSFLFIIFILIFK
jgi:4-hydroxybenzoate polyprenyltransferase